MKRFLLAPTQKTNGAIEFQEERINALEGRGIIDVEAN